MKASSRAMRVRRKVGTSVTILELGTVKVVVSGVAPVAVKYA